MSKQGIEIARPSHLLNKSLGFNVLQLIVRFMILFVKKGKTMISLDIVNGRV